MNDAVGRSALGKVSWHVLPLLGLGYAVAYVDRINISFAALQMNQELHFNAAVYGLGAALFSLSYCVLEIPSNIFLARFGARRWISRIMLTWGALAVSMMFVKTPAQFYVARFALGMAEAGFFPGVLYYLKQWYPALYSGRAISRFYIAVPLGAAFMGAISGPLLNLSGVAGLSGWQWLFLIEGLPAILLSMVIFFRLPDGPQQAPWLSERERGWIASSVAQDAARPGSPSPYRFKDAALDPAVWTLGGCNFLILASNYAFALSAPTLLRDRTHWSPTVVGWVMSGSALLGVGAMLFNGWHSDQHGHRHAHVAIPLCAMAASLAVIAGTGSPLLIVLAYVTYYLGTYAVQAAFWPIPSITLQGRSAAVGLAAVGSIGMFGAFVGPYAWGLAREHTGSYRTGLISVAVVYLATGGLVWSLRIKSMPRP